MQITTKKLTLALLLLFVLILAAMPVSANPFGGTVITGIDEPPDTHTGKTPAPPGQNPWQVAIIFNDAPTIQRGFVCGGSLIAPDWVLTAAHCVDFAEPDDLDVIVGREKLSGQDGEQIGSTAFYIHSGWGDNNNYDIALIKLSRPATQGQFLPLQKSNQPQLSIPGTMSKVTGWGALSLLADEVPDTLHQVEMPIVTQAQCRASYENDPVINETVICAGTRAAGTDPCFGDSGGPLTVANPNGGRVLVGIVSFGRGCGFVGQYGVYTRVSFFEDWVMNQLNGVGGDVIVVETLTEPAQNTFFQFSATSLPFGYEFVDGYVTSDEIGYFYENADGDPLDIFAFNDQFEDLDELIEEAEIEFDEDELFIINGQKVLIGEFGAITSALFVKGDAVVIVDAFVTIEQMQTLVKAVLDSN